MDSTIDLNNDSTFSIDDTALVYYRKISQEEIDTHALTTLDPFDNIENANLLQALSVLNKESNIAIFEVSAKSAELASYLNILDIKINLLIERILTPHNKQQQKPQQILLSQRGLSFGTDAVLHNNDLLVIKFILNPSYQIITLKARVLDSYPKTENQLADPNYPFWTNTSFEDITPIYDQWLAKHILNKQVTLRKTRTNN